MTRRAPKPGPCACRLSSLRRAPAVAVPRSSAVPDEACGRDPLDRGPEAATRAQAHAENALARRAGCRARGEIGQTAESDEDGDPGTGDRPAGGVDCVHRDERKARTLAVRDRPDPESV